MPPATLDLLFLRTWCKGPMLIPGLYRPYFRFLKRSNKNLKPAKSRPPEKL